MLRILISSLLLLLSADAGAADHFLPLEGGIDELHQNSSESWFKTLKKGDLTFLELDTFPAIGPLPSYLGVIAPNLQGPFRLCYLEDSYDKAGPLCVPIPPKFAVALNDRAGTILKQLTYDDGKPGVSPVDPTMYYLKAGFIYAESRHVDTGSVPDRLIKTLSRCATITKLSPEDPARQKLMDEILKDLDAIEPAER
ncbi:MAG TPA: hypothetical protein VHP13_00850 [Gammaproteobacteria bacterium]|nr:hypothetical protein [Gammaproteobacteria bacterium]